MSRGRKKKTSRPMRYPNGYGSVYMLSNPERRRNPFVVMIPDGKEIITGKNGKPRIKYKYLPYGYTKTREEGDELLKKYHDQKEKGILFDKSDITFEDVYKLAYERMVLISKPSDDTKTSYDFGFKHCSNIHKMDMKKIRAADMQEIINNMINNEYKTPSLRCIRKVFNLVYNFAVENDLVNKNYALFVKLGKSTKSKKRRAIPENEIQYMFDHDDIQNVDLILIYIFTGLRLNELLKLETVNMHLDQRYIQTGSKTESGIDRIIPINHKIENYLRNRFNPNQKYFLESSNNTKYEKNNFRSQIFTPAMNDLGFDYTPHECRHTCATLLDNAGANKVASQKILGHKGNDIDEQVYIHKTLNELLKAIDMI